MGDMRIAYSILVGKREGKRPLGRPRCSWENDIREGMSGTRDSPYSEQGGIL